MPMPAIARIAGIRPVRVGEEADRLSADSSADPSHRDDAMRRELARPCTAL
jgi:hypothetical protein